MSSNRHDIPADLSGVVKRLESERPRPTDLELDRMKVKVLSRASRGRSTRARVGIPSRRLATVVLAVVLLGGGGGVLAKTGGPISAGSSPKSASDTQYKPGKGCGDKNHVHAREDECKKGPK